MGAKPELIFDFLDGIIPVLKNSITITNNNENDDKNIVLNKFFSPWKNNKTSP